MKIINEAPQLYRARGMKDAGNGEESENENQESEEKVRLKKELERKFRGLNPEMRTLLLHVLSMMAVRNHSQMPFSEAIMSIVGQKKIENLWFSKSETDMENEEKKTKLLELLDILGESVSWGLTAGEMWSVLHMDDQN